MRIYIYQSISALARNLPVADSIKMSVTRSELRKTRNKIYVRLLSRKCVWKQLRHYQSKIEVFIEESLPELSNNEIAALFRRVQITEKAAEESSKVSGYCVVGDEGLRG